MRCGWRTGFMVVVLGLVGCAEPAERAEVAAAESGAVERVTPFGAWQSPLGAELLARAAVGVADLQVAAGVPYWQETRPDEGGRMVIQRLSAGGAPEQLLPEGYSARTRVHEYGGAAYQLAGNVLLFSNFADQRLYLLRESASAPEPLTPPGYHYADCVVVPGSAAVICVREDHTEATVAANGEERNEIVRLNLPPGPADGDDAGTVLVSGADFVAYPRVSPDGASLAWIEWNHPDMPWDSTALRVARLDAGGIGPSQKIAGGPDEAPLEPQWDQDGTLYFVSDPDGWWNLYRWREGVVQPVAPMAREFGGPLWSHGASSYALTGDGRALVRTSLAGFDQLGVLDLERGELRFLDLPFVAFSAIRLLDSGTGLAIAQSETAPAAIIRVDLATGDYAVIHQPVTAELGPEWVVRAEAIEFPTTPGPDGAPRTAHAFFYPPANPGYPGRADTLPPLLVLIHGGPTSVARPVYSAARSYWTSRGFALVDVNYGGSTTFGRDYRQRLNGGWGIVDVQDAVAAVDYLIATGRVDPDRVAIRGGSAGGYTALAALAFTDRFNAGANYYGISDIAALAATSHKFERLYDVSLVGPPDEALYRSRSPLYQLDGFSSPLITFQGSEDRVVPPEQSRLIVAALRERGIPAAYLEFEGEQHGFRRAENIIRAAEAELWFYGQVFGFTPADAIEPVEIIPGMER